MDRQQKYLNFTRGDKLYILREAAPFMPNSRMIRVLRAIDEKHWQYERHEPSVTLTHRQIASYDGMSVPTVRRGIADLIKFNFLFKTETFNSHGQQANSYQIVWSNLDAVIIDGEPLTDPAPVSESPTVDISETPAPDLEYELSQVVKVAGDHSEYPPDHHDQPPDHSDQPPPDHHDQASLYSKSINPPPPSNQPTWMVVEENLNLVKVGCAAKAATTARDRGCQPAEILQLIEYARSKPGAYGPGAIFKRVSEMIPGSNPAEGWPAVSKKYRQKKNQEKRQAKLSQAAQLAAKRQEKLNADKLAQEILERDFGPQLDQMSRYERLDFARAHCVDLLIRALVKDPDAYQSNFYRPELLRALKDQATGLPGESQSAVVDGMAIADRK